MIKNNKAVPRCAVTMSKRSNSVTVNAPKAPCTKIKLRAKVVAQGSHILKSELALAKLSAP